MHDLVVFAHFIGPYLRLADAMRVPEFGAIFLLAFPFLAWKPAQSLFLGLFDQKPGSLFLVTLAVNCLAAAVIDTGHLILLGTRDPRIEYLKSLVDTGTPMGREIWFAVMLILVAPTLLLAIGLSTRQKRSAAGLSLAAIAGLAVSGGVTWLLMVNSAKPAMAVASSLQSFASQIDVFRSIRALHPDLLAEHVLAGAASVVTGLTWAGFGIYGYFNLGRSRTVPALASLLMLVMMLIWPLSAVTFYLDYWHIPSLLILIVAALATVTAQSRLSDHTYKLVDLPADVVDQPTPSQVLEASGAPAVIVVSAEGGGIQAAAWTAQVLEGLRSNCTSAVFDPALRMISSVSGGSVGAACYLDWLLHPGKALPPTQSSADSSLDEVAWGLTWPDFLRALCPWAFGWMIDRAEALQRAWSHNAATNPDDPRFLKPLSEWRKVATSGNPPAPSIIMNSTVVENGFRLLMGTSHLDRCLATLAREDASAINCIGDKPMDIHVVTAARLSASFTWVTPAARADADSLKPHLVDGGYYDNYGMATLVEWLDEALNGMHGAYPRVLVLQIHSSPVTGEGTPSPGASKPPATATRGWAFQMLAPFLALLNVRSAGQLAHNDIELTLLQDKWRGRAAIDTVHFTFPGTQAPLSWHLIPNQQAAIRKAWDDKMQKPIQVVKDFLSGTTPPSGGGKPPVESVPVASLR